MCRRQQINKFEPRHDKTNNVAVHRAKTRISLGVYPVWSVFTVGSMRVCSMRVHPVKTQISLGIRPVWSESSLCAQWVAKDPSFLHADSEDSDQTGCPGWSKSSLGAHSFCWFCHVAPHFPKMNWFSFRQVRDSLSPRWPAYRSLTDDW